MRIRVLRRAQYQLRQIFEYIESEFGETVADSFQQEVIEKGERIRKYPDAGHPEPLLIGHKRNYRYVIIGKHNKMLYYVSGETIVVADIWDMRMNPDKLKRHI